jgi:transposase
MPWQEVSIVDQRREFVRLAMQEGVNRRELCRRFGIHPDTGYKWLARWAAKEDLVDRSRRPHSSPSRTEATIEVRILALRDAHPAWGARKIMHCLKREGAACPVHSTVHEILRRHGRIVEPPGGALRLTCALRSLSPTSFGRWISRGTCRSRAAGGAIP